jgi:hypothetical protein
VDHLRRGGAAGRQGERYHHRPRRDRGRLRALPPDGKPTFVYNYLALERPTFAGTETLPKDKATIGVDFVYDGGGMGKGGTVSVTANGKKVAGGRLERTVPVKFSICEGLDIGMDGGSPVDFTYQVPFGFTGTIDKVTIDLKKT